MERWDYNFTEMTKALDVMVKEQKKNQGVKTKTKEFEERKQAKMEAKEREIEDKRRIRLEQRENQKRKKAIELKRKKVIWKCKYLSEWAI